jgi:hypothetical protein
MHAIKRLNSTNKGEEKDINSCKEKEQNGQYSGVKTDESPWRTMKNHSPLL